MSQQFEMPRLVECVLPIAPVWELWRTQKADTDYREV